MREPETRNWNPKMSISFGGRKSNDQSRPKLATTRSGENVFAPAPNAAVHGEHVGVAHFLQIVRGQRGAISAAAVEDDGRVQFRHAFLDIALDDALAQVNGPRQMVFGVLAFFPDIHQNELVAAVKSGFDVVNAHFSNPLFGIFDDTQKTSRMLVRHRTPSLQSLQKSILAEID